MALWFAALLGFIQGLTEFIPVSSTAHLKVLPSLLGQPYPGTAYIAVIQLGTLVAVIAYFARDLAELTIAMFRSSQATADGQLAGHPPRLAFLLAVGTLPVVVVGLLLKHRIENDLNSLYLIASALILIGIVMAVIDHFAAARDVTRPFASLTYRDALLVGLAQTLALVPGVSRSGATICMALLLGFARSDAARFSFLLSIPAVAGAGILEAGKSFRELGGEAIPSIAVGIGVAAITGYAAIAWILRWLGTHQLVGFAIYRIVAGLALLGALAAGLIRSV